MRHKKTKIGVLFGGRSAEHEVSLDSARSVIKALDKKKYHIMLVFINKNGQWLDPKGSFEILQGRKSNFHRANKNGYLILREADVVFPVLHGPYGEDGRVQGMIETLDIPYIGSNVLASSIGMNKAIQREIFKFEKLPLLKWFSFSLLKWRRYQKLILKRIKANFDLPVFVKPVDLGSSIGISKVQSWGNVLVKAIEKAFLYSQEVIIEQGIDAREIECAVLGNNDYSQASVPGEIIPSGEFYDYRAKYIDNQSKLIIPAPLSASLTRKIQRFSLRAFRAIRAEGMARVDFLLERKKNKLYLNEINTLPGFTKISMYPKLWEASGIQYSQLMDILVELALERHKREKKRQLSN